MLVVFCGVSVVIAEEAIVQVMVVELTAFACISNSINYSRAFSMNKNTELGIPSESIIIIKKNTISGQTPSFRM